jgi:hypothetical protein
VALLLFLNRKAISISFLTSVHVIAPYFKAAFAKKAIFLGRPHFAFTGGSLLAFNYSKNKCIQIVHFYSTRK